MNNEDYVSYELAKKLKECGFDEPCNYGYSVKMRLEPEVSFGKPKMVHSKAPKNYNDNRKGIEKGLSFCSAPTLAHAQKWLREPKGIAISIIAHDGGLYHSERIILPNCMIPESREWYVETTTPMVDSYESALVAGIDSALKLLDNPKRMTI